MTVNVAAFADCAVRGALSRCPVFARNARDSGAFPFTKGACVPSTVDTWAVEEGRVVPKSKDLELHDAGLGRGSGKVGCRSRLGPDGLQL